MIVKAHGSSEKLVAEPGCAPMSAARDFGQVAADVQSFELPADRVRLPAADVEVAGVAVDRSANIGIAEAVQGVLTIEHGVKQAHVLQAGWIEAGETTVAD